MDQAFLLVVFDGLRPDLVRADTTPNIMRFATIGTGFNRARSVFPSETRVCSASVVTGCLPRRHGLVANRIVHPLDAARSVDTGHKANLLALEQELGAPLLDAPTLGEILHRAGRDFAVLSSGTTGQTHVLNPHAAALGQVTLSGHGAAACSPAGARLLATLDPPPADPVGRALWIAEIFRTRFLPAPPAATLLWLCEPDTSAHYQGLGSPGNLDALRAADAAFGRILDDWQAGPQRERLTIAVASDHGHAGISGLVDVGAALAEFAPGCTVLPGNSGGIAIPGGDARRVAELAEWLTRQDWAGCVFAADGAELPQGVLPRSLLLADHPRAAPVLFTLRSNTQPSRHGLPGSTLYDGDLPVGGGTHGGLSAAELHTVLLLAGAPIHVRRQSDWPAGLVDIAPTVLALLGLEGGEAMDGRVLTEALQDGADPAVPPAAETWEATEGDYAQRLTRTRLGRQTYLDASIRV
jgi:arylsulfatase A-like enzyme